MPTCHACNATTGTFYHIRGRWVCRDCESRVETQRILKIRWLRPRWVRKVVSAVTAIGFPGYGRCHRCGWPWKWGCYHVTYDADRRGCFPLCVWCWAELSPKDRLPFYFELWSNWSCPKRPWASIEDAVLTGR